MFIVIDNNEGRMVKSICLCDGEEENHINCLSVFGMQFMCFCSLLRILASFRMAKQKFSKKGECRLSSNESVLHGKKPKSAAVRKGSGVSML